MLVPASDRVKRFGHEGADHFVGDVGQLGAALLRTHWHGHGQVRGMLLGNGQSRSAHGRAGGQTIVDQNHMPSSRADGRMAAAVAQFAAGQLCLFAGQGFGHDLGGHAVQRVHHPHPAAGNGAHGVLLVAGQAEFAHHPDVQGRVQGLGHFKAYGHPAARQRQHQQGVLVPVMAQGFGQGLAGISSVSVGRFDSAQRSHVGVSLGEGGGPGFAISWAQAQADAGSSAAPRRPQCTPQACTWGLAVG